VSSVVHDVGWSADAFVSAHPSLIFVARSVCYAPGVVGPLAKKPAVGAIPVKEV
jgi:hypothetical protein